MNTRQLAATLVTAFAGWAIGTAIAVVLILL